MDMHLIQGSVDTVDAVVPKKARRWPRKDSTIRSSSGPSNLFDAHDFIAAHDIIPTLSTFKLYARSRAGRSRGHAERESFRDGATGGTQRLAGGVRDFDGGIDGAEASGVTGNDLLFYERRR